MQVQAPPTYAPPGFTPAGGSDDAGMFNAFYEATSPIAFDFAADMTAQPQDVATIVSSSYDDIGRAHATLGQPYHVVPLLSRVYATANAYPRPRVRVSRPGVDAVSALGEPHRSVLHLMERHRFSPENTAAILGLDVAGVVEAHEDARAVAHGVSAAVALCPGGVPACAALAAELEPGAGVVGQTERILAHAERCDWCLQTALQSPDPIKELRRGATTKPAPAPFAPRATPFNGAQAGQYPALAAGSVPLPGPVPVPGPAPSANASREPRPWPPLRLWSQASGWQKSGAIMAVLLIAALVIAIVAGGDGEDVSARTNASTTVEGGQPNRGTPIPTIPSTVPPPSTTEPITTAPVEQVGTQPPYAHSGSDSSSSSNSSGSASSSQPIQTEPPRTVPDTTAPPATVPPPPEVTSHSWGTSRYPTPPTYPPTRAIDFTFVSTGTTVTYTTSWGASGNLLAGEGTLSLAAVPLGNQTITLTVNGPGGTATASYQAPWL